MAAKSNRTSASGRRTNAQLEAELKRVAAERDEAIAQQTATAEVLQIINSSPGDLGPVFDAMLEKAMRLCEAAFGGLFTYDGEFYRNAAHRNLPAVLTDAVSSPIRAHSAGGALSAVADGAHLIHLPDITDTEDYRSGLGYRRMLADLGGARTALWVALRKDHALLGLFVLYRTEIRAFTDKQIALVQNFAAQAVIAMENARLITETREALDQQTATAEVLQVINSSPGDLAPVFEAMLEKAIRLCEAAFGSLWTYDGEVFHSVATRNVPAELVDFVRRPYPAGPTTPLGRVARTRGIVSISDLATDEASQSGDETDRQWLAGPIELGGARSYLAVPLMKDDALVGAFALSRREIRPFSEKQIALVQNFAQQAVIAMENARLLSELRQRTEEVAGLNRGLEARVAEQVEELGRVGRLKRFLAPQLAEMIVSQGDENILESHRREIVVVFCDLRGYTAFTETAEPEEVLEFLREYHGALGPLVSQYEGTLDQFSGDGIMVFFNDPVPIPDPAERAIHMAMAMREAASGLIAGWRERGRGLGFGAGIAQGYATLGQIGFSERSGYTAIGTVCNVAARLCAEAKDGQILLSQRVNAALKGSVATEQVGDLALKGLTQPVTTYNVPLTANHPTLRVIEGGPVGA
jgi:class 3 adenylate cyclase